MDNIFVDRNGYYVSYGDGVLLKLIADTTDADFFRKSMNERGTTVYMENSEGNIIEVVYFSGSRLIRMVGDIPEDLAKVIKAEGHKFKSIEIDPITETVNLK